MSGQFCTLAIFWGVLSHYYGDLNTTKLTTKQPIEVKITNLGPKFYFHHGFLVFPLSPLPHKDSLLPLQSRFVGSSTLHLVGPRSKYRGLPSIIFRLGLKIPFPPANPHLQEEGNSSGNSYKTRTDTVFIISKSGGWEMNVIHSKV